MIVPDKDAKDAAKHGGPAKADGKPDCWKCQHHYITHHPGFPYGCRAMGFKSRRLPCLEVLETSGKACLMFQPKP